MTLRDDIVDILAIVCNDALGSYLGRSPSVSLGEKADQILALGLMELDPDQERPKNPYTPSWAPPWEHAQQAMWEDGFRRVKPKEVQDA